MNQLPLVLFFLLFSYESKAQNSSFLIRKTDDEWKKQLTPTQYKILREKATERAFTGAYNDTFDKGSYHCVGCGALLYVSTNKYNTHCGWPSFDRGVNDNIGYREDRSHGMVRVEIYCKKCGGHLGHIFNDGPKNTTGKRHCVNSTSLKFVSQDKTNKKL